VRYLGVCLLLSAALAQSAWAGECHYKPGVAGQDVTVELEHDGELRSYVLHLPSDYDCTPRPVLIGVHGYTGSGLRFENEWAGIFDHVNKHGYIGVFPNGMAASADAPRATGFNDIGSLNDDGPDGLTCDPPPFEYPFFENCPESFRQRTCYWGNSCADDLGFFRAMLKQVKQRYAVDVSRIYMVGYSQGASTVNGFAAEMADVLAAVAPIHGFQSNGYSRAPESPLPFMQVWGRLDETIRPDGKPGLDRLIYDTPEENAQVWAKAQGCDVDRAEPYPTTADGRLNWSCTHHPDCRAGSEVVSCAWDGEHVWPGEPGDNYGWDVIWQFLSNHRRAD
jgi:poly(3-hydroxybutyrate) depolymerase